MKINRKQDQYFKKIETYKTRFRKLSTAELKHRFTLAPMIKEALIAYRQVLEERGENPKIGE